MLEFKKEILSGLRDFTGLSIYLPQQEIGNIVFPLLTLEMEVSDDETTLDHKVRTHAVKFDIFFYSDDIEEVLTNSAIKQYFHSLGFRCTYESNPGKTHHWYKQYQFECVVYIKDEDYIIL